jgi:hypothetical protein
MRLAIIIISMMMIIITESRYQNMIEVWQVPFLGSMIHTSTLTHVINDERHYIFMNCNHGTCPGDDIKGGNKLIYKMRFTSVDFHPPYTCDSVIMENNKFNKYGVNGHVCNNDAILEIQSVWFGKPNRSICDLICNHMIRFPQDFIESFERHFPIMNCVPNKVVNKPFVNIYDNFNYSINDDHAMANKLVINNLSPHDETPESDKKFINKRRDLITGSSGRYHSIDIKDLMFSDVDLNQDPHSGTFKWNKRDNLTKFNDDVNCEIIHKSINDVIEKRHSLDYHDMMMNQYLN